MLYSAFENDVEKYVRRVFNKSWKNFRAFLRDWKTRFIETEMMVEVIFLVYNLKFKSFFFFPFPILDNKCKSFSLFMVENF